MKVALAFTEISQRLHRLELPPVDVVVGIMSGGIVPASLLAHQLGKPLYWVSINYRDEQNQPRHPAPTLIADPALPTTRSRVLLVDDVAVSGQTMRLAQALLSEHAVVTLVMKGQADYVVFPEISECVQWPWKP